MSAKALDKEKFLGYLRETQNQTHARIMQEIAKPEANMNVISVYQTGYTVLAEVTKAIEKGTYDMEV